MITDKFIVGSKLALVKTGVGMTAEAHCELREALPADEDFHAAMRDLIDRHVNGEWGDVCAHDAKVNEQAVRSGARVLSSYTVEGVSLWVISDAAWTDEPKLREQTTILRPEDY
jgi:hypothetical protein